MAVAYDIKAIPTVYGARQFRSRLEAKWASFFSLCGWQFEYEPFDLGTWSPDFLLIGAYRKVLVEVKPITVLDEDVTDKMIAAARAAKWDGDLLLIGVAPLFDMDYGPFEAPAIGWLGEVEPNDDSTNWWFGRASACLMDYEKPDFTHDEGIFTGRMHGVHYKDNTWPDNSDWLKRIWDKAANRVQWHKR